MRFILAEIIFSAFTLSNNSLRAIATVPISFPEELTLRISKLPAL